MEDICNVFGLVDRYLAKAEWSQYKDKMNITVKEEARKRIIAKGTQTIVIFKEFVGYLVVYILFSR